MQNERIIVAARGGPENLKLVSEPMPVPGPGQVLIRAAASGVAYADVMMREGLYPGAPPFPLTPGYDVVGTVAALGSGVTGLSVGDSVAALTVHGCYARNVLAQADDAVPVPDGLDPAEAVSLVLNYLTAWQMLHRCAHVAAGDAVLVHGAAGGVGTALLQLGQLAGLTCYGTASAGKHKLVAELGGIPIDYRTEDFVARVKRDGDGVLAVFDPIGGAHWKRSYAALAPTGTLVCYGFYDALSGGRRSLIGAARTLLGMPRYSPLKLFGDNKAITPYIITAWRDRRRSLYRQDLASLFALLAEGKITPVIAERVPLADAARAHDLLGNARLAGKIVLV
jgi:NADPH:quinone reductase-like Zn-dependent oxidoreductase